MTNTSTETTQAPTFLAAVLEQARTRRAQRAERRRLERELATYTTAAELDDLAAILDRHSDAEAAPVREILARHRAA